MGPMVMRDLSALTEEEISRLLSKSHGQLIESNYPPELLSPAIKPAAVLIPMLRIGENWHLLFIHRTHNQRDPHSGQVAFPGGACDPADTTPEATALREAQEEIGLQPKDVRILGRLNDFLTVTSYRVTPIVATIPWPYPLHLETREVTRAFTIPLAWLADPANHSVQLRPLPPPYKPIPVIYFQPYDGEVLWGASARFTLCLIEKLKARE